MTTISVKLDNKVADYISQRQTDVNSYFSNLVKEDMLLNSIKESEESGFIKLTSLDDLNN